VQVQNQHEEGLARFVRNRHLATKLWNVVPVGWI
jgi:hypothetical protein